MVNIQSVEELRRFLENEAIGTVEAAEILGCTRQNIKRLVDNGKLVPIKTLERDRLFLKADILKRKEETNKRINK